MDKTSEKPKSKITPKSDIDSPNMGPTNPLKILGGMPPTEKVEQIEKINMPRARGAAPGSVGM